MFLENSLEFILNSIHANREFTDAYVNSNDQTRYYKKVSNRKSDGSLRWIFEPLAEEHKNLYKQLYEQLKAYQSELHPAVHGFRQGYSNATNAAQHLQANHLLNIDIENFYGQINLIDVLAVFLGLGADTEVADYLSKLCTIDGELPQGLNTSPDIANHYLENLDSALQEYADEHEITYTRYVDDMSFSSETQIETSEICDIVSSFGLPLAETKRKYQKRGSNQYVTGLTIFDSKHPRISKKYKKRLRLELHVVGKVGINNFVIKLNELPDEPTEESAQLEWRKARDEWADKKLSQIRGRLDYVNGVEPELAAKMYPLLVAIIEARKKDLSKEQ